MVGVHTAPRVNRARSDRSWPYLGRVQVHPIARASRGRQGHDAIIPKYHRAKLSRRREIRADPASNILVGTSICRYAIARSPRGACSLQRAFWNGWRSTPRRYGRPRTPEKGLAREGKLMRFCGSWRCFFQSGWGSFRRSLTGADGRDPRTSSTKSTRSAATMAQAFALGSTGVQFLGSPSALSIHATGLSRGYRQATSVLD